MCMKRFERKSAAGMRSILLSIGSIPGDMEIPPPLSKRNLAMQSSCAILITARPEGMDPSIAGIRCCELARRH